ncbi:hypothetical protein HZA98_04825, partial [Candidatus Woesearchaeota archaeon]|nr:hypothetical protein [Candidatus Woesearchaeota archaeon]
MAIDAAEQIEKFQEFIEQSYQKQLHENMNKGLNYLLVDFFDITKYDPKLADQLLEEPEETTKAAEMALEQFEVKKGFRIRFRNLPKSQEIYIRNLRSKHLNKFIAMEGIIRQSSEVRPQAVSAKFECPSCGNTITMPQIDQQFREPSRCSCGRKGKFRLLSKELVDVQRLVIEESPENLEGGAQPKRMQIFLREDLVEPRMEKRTTPGTRILTNGLLYEIPIQTKTGATSTRFDLAVQANYIEPVEEDYSEISISPEDEKEIKKLARDKQVNERLIRSIAPSIYGHEKIKEAILLQLFGGIRKTKKDGTIVRGDLHVLLVGDPGCIAGDSLVALHNKGLKQIQSLGKEHGQSIHIPVVKIRKNSMDKAYDYATVFQKYEKQPVLKLVTETGKEIICTLNQPVYTEEGWRRADCLTLGEKIRVMPHIPHLVTDLVSTEFSALKRTYGPLKEVHLPEFFDSELAALCGYILGDGNLHPKGYRVTCYINEEEKELLAQLQSLWKNVFGVEAASILRKASPHLIIDTNGYERVIHSVQDLHLLEVNSKQIAHSLSFLSTKRVPQKIFQSPKAVIASFLRWLFEADGCAFGNGRGRTSIQLKSRSPGLLKDVQQLLLFFGIQSRIIEDNLCIRRALDMDQFITDIGFVSQKKKNALLRVSAVVEERKDKRQLRKRYQSWEKVVSLDFAGVQDVYDFEVPVSKSFIANGILCHNSGKSQMLTFVNNTAPKSRYVAGRSASGAGLCVSPQSKVLLNPGGIEKISSFVNPKVEGLSQYCHGVWRKEKVTDIKVQSMGYDFKVHSQYPAALWKLESPSKMIEVRLQSGKKIELTANTQLYSIQNGYPLWKKSIELKEGDYIATPRQLIGGNEDKVYIVDLIDSNPVVHDIKGFIQEIVVKLQKKYGSIRIAARALKVHENNLYHHWVRKDARGNIKLQTLKKLAQDVGLEYRDKVKTVSLYNGKKHSLPTFVSLDLLYLTGLLVGDGNLRKSYQFGFSNSSETLQLKYQSILQKEFSLHFSLQKAVTSKRPQCTIANSRILSEILLKLGMQFSPKSNIITFTPILLHFSNTLLASFIAGYFDSDGSVGKRKDNNRVELAFCSGSEEMLRTLQLVFLRYGMHWKLRVRQPAEGRIKSRLLKWELSSSAQSEIEKFYRHIPIAHTLKKNKIESRLKEHVKADTNIDIIPCVQYRVKQLLQSKRISLRKSHWHSHGFSPCHLKKVLDSAHIKDEGLSYLAESDLFWEKIVSVCEFDSPYDYVYDLTVEDSHNFVVDGILVHNTCSVVKDEFLRGWALEAGAMVLADKGILVLDEMDKISKEDTSALHEAMEQQSYHPEFKIMFADGSVEKIGSFVDQLFEKYPEKKQLGKNCEILPVSDIHVLTTDFKKIFSIPVNRVSRHAAPDFFIEVTFSHGRKVVVTPEHPFFVFQNNVYTEIAACDLKEGLFVPAPRKLPFLEKKNTLIQSDLRFVKIKSIKTIKNTDAQWVYDVTVEPTQNFLSEGLVLHNSISVAKANIQATLRTQTSILAAANPKLGRFDPITPIPNQIDMPPALINRFDLIFVMRDLPNKDLDEKIATRVLDSHAAKEPAPEIEAKFIRKYLAYAKQKVFPKLTQKAIDVIKAYYVELRSTSTHGDGGIKPIPISARQLEAVVRLAEASARIKLKSEVEEEDAIRAVALLRYCMTEVGMDPETGKIDLDRMT